MTFAVDVYSMSSSLTVNLLGMTMTKFGYSNERSFSGYYPQEPPMF